MDTLNKITVLIGIEETNKPIKNIEIRQNLNQLAIFNPTLENMLLQSET